MRFLFLIFILLILSIRQDLNASFLIEIKVSSVSLAQCYSWAKERSETLKMRQEEIEQFEAHARSILGSAYPEVNWELSSTWQDPNGIHQLEKKGFSGFARKNQVESYLSIHQPLFSGLREYSSYRGFLMQKESHVLLLKTISRNLYEQTAVMFYSVLSLETELKNINLALTLAKDRIQELKLFLSLGKSRESEVFTAEARFFAIQAQAEQIRAKIESAKIQLCYLTGRNLSNVIFMDTLSNFPSFDSLENIQKIAKNRSDILAQKKEIVAAQFRVKYKKGFYWPKLELNGRYHTQRSGVLEDIDWDIMFLLKLPIYQGGSVVADIRESESMYRHSLFVLDDLERRISQAIHKLYVELSGSIRESQSLDEAVDGAQKSYDALLKEYRLGLVTNLDVLQALDLLQVERSSLDSARIKTKLLYLQLLVAMEQKP